MTQRLVKTALLPRLLLASYLVIAVFGTGLHQLGHCEHGLAHAGHHHHHGGCDHDEPLAVDGLAVYGGLAVSGTDESAEHSSLDDICPVCQYRAQGQVATSGDEFTWSEIGCFTRPDCRTC